MTAFPPAFLVRALDFPGKNLDMRRRPTRWPGAIAHEAHFVLSEIDREHAMTDTTGANNKDAAAAANDIARAVPAADAEALAKEVAESKDKLLRALADMENLRRRTEREIAEARAYAISSFAEDLVGVVDNMYRALDAV